MRNFSDSDFITALSGLAKVERDLVGARARGAVRRGKLHAARVVDQDADDVLLRDRRLDDQDRPEDAEQDDAEGRHAQDAQHRALAPLRPATGPAGS